ncbi:MAG: glycoside hydrolase family 127 protein [Clostridia bacterium]|nr:glycoside hydrolase family 127 protein [Clostridia bacterium]
MNFTNEKSINAMYAPRIKTDALFELAPGSFRYDGVYDSVAKFVERHQSKNSKLWRTFVNQFRNPVDFGSGGGWSGEFWGKMMRGACWIYKYTTDEELYTILEDSVRELISVQEPNGRISSYEIENEFTYWDMWCRKYVLLGMQYFYDICRDEALKEDIVHATCRHLDYIIDHIGEEDGKIDILESTTHNPATWGALNSSSILEPVVRQYSLTKNHKYLDFASYLVRRGGSKWGNIYTLAIEGIKAPYEYPVRKAYEATSYFEGVLEYYRVTGDEDARRAYVNFIAKVVETDFTLIGCAGTEHELFNHSSLLQTEPNEYVKQETCVTVTLMKAFYQALCLTGEAKYADAMERAAYNAMLGSVNLTSSASSPKHEAQAAAFATILPFMQEIGGFTFDSYAPLYKDRRNRCYGGFRNMPGGTAYGCCACIGSAGIAVMPLSSVMSSKSGAVINHLMNGTVQLSGSISLTINTDYPYGECAKITVNTAAPVSFDLKIRVPEASLGKMTINGAIATPDELGYATLGTEWCGGETVTVTIPRELTVTELNGKIAVTNGIIVYALDQRIENIDKKFSEKIVSAEPAKVSFAHREAMNITFSNGESATFVDFASAGADWGNEKGIITIWMDKE